MRSSFRSLLLVLPLVAAITVSARADLITLSISEQATGTLGSQAFTNQLLTFTESFTSEAFVACQADYSCVEGDGQFFVDIESGLVTTITVGSLGTFLGTGVDGVLFDYSGNLATIVPLYAEDTGGRFAVPTSPETLGDSCSAYLSSYYCPIYAQTSGGDLMLTSVGDTYSTSVEISDTSAVPEPGTLTLLTTGLLGAAGILRRRLLR
jgi:PEP-CTERM motif